MNIILKIKDKSKKIKDKSKKIKEKVRSVPVKFLVSSLCLSM
jgi:hypothetical protein